MHENIINLFGEKISDLINKHPTACKGLVRFSIIDYRKNNNIIFSKAITYNEFNSIINEILKEKLIIANIDNIDSIIEELILELKKNQAIFTMTL